MTPAEQAIWDYCWPLRRTNDAARHILDLLVALAQRDEEAS